MTYLRCISMGSPGRRTDSHGPRICRWIAALALGAALYAPAVDAQTYERQLIAPNVYSFGGGGYFSMFVVTDAGVVVMDPVDPDFAAAMRLSIAEVTPQAPVFVIYSHDHWDHIRGGAVFKSEGATIISHQLARESILARPHPDVVVPDIAWSGDQRDITFGGTDFELYYFGENHGNGMTGVLLPAERVLFTVDLVKPQTVGFAILPETSPRQWVRTLFEIDALPFDTILMGHRDHSAPKSVVAEQRQFLIDLDNAVQARLDAGQSPFSIPDTLELPQYQTWEDYDEYLSLNTWRVVFEKWLGW